MMKVNGRKVRFFFKGTEGLGFFFSFWTTNDDARFRGDGVKGYGSGGERGRGTSNRMDG